MTVLTAKPAPSALARNFIHIAGLGVDDTTRGGERISALAQVDLALAPGEFCAIVGPSGCGKSTLPKVLAGLVPATSGYAAIAGDAVGVLLVLAAIGIALFMLADWLHRRIVFWDAPDRSRLDGR